jgi:hypothetical protein
MNRLVGAALVLALTTAFGCRRATPQFESRPTFPVEGLVLIQGQPAEGVQVFLHPDDPTQRGKPRGTTDAEGRFHLRTYHDGDGAPPGEYTVTVYWPAPYRPDVAVEDQLPPDRLGERFMNPKDSSLRATVTAGPTTLPPFEIK